MVYHLMCICIKCSNCFKVFVKRSDLPEKLVQMIEQIRSPPSNKLSFSEWETIGSELETYQRLALLRLMDADHKCFAKIPEDRFPDVGVDMKKSSGKLTDYNLLAERGRAGKVLPVLHEINTKHFAFLPKRTVLIDVFFSVSPEMLIDTAIKKKQRRKNKKRLEESTSLQE